ncbi:MAG TPA: geranylgeranyl reductase family protein [Thermoplasmata archaeon]|nr:geranylgeranyl reductase family protein [Thermoplasmata archaeon]
MVGAGPAGSSAARAAAEGGARTLLVDQRRELGAPAQCGEFLPTPTELADLFGPEAGIARLYRIPPETILRETRSMACVAPSGRRYRFPLQGFEVSRRAFDKRLALDAEGAGAELRHPCGITEVRGHTVRAASGVEFEAKVVIGADGPLSVVGRSVGLPRVPQMYQMVTATVEGQFPDEIELHFGRVAPGGYAWVFPKLDAANVGLGVPARPPGRTLEQLLDGFLSGRGIGPARDHIRWWVPLGPPPVSAVSGCAMLAGDAAHLVMATNGGGIPTAILSGAYAGRVAADHVRRGGPLSEYDHLLARHLSGPLDRAWKIKQFSDRFAAPDLLLSLAMRYIGSEGLDAMMRLRWPKRLRRNS